MRNERGQVQQAATNRLREAAQPAAPAAEPVPTGARGAFGQRTDAVDESAASNRADRRAAKKK